MKILKIITIVGVCWCLMASSCNDDNSTSIEITCIEGIVIGKFSSSGGGIAVSLSKAAFDSEDSRQIFDDNNTYSNVVQVLNLKEEYNIIGTNIFFTARIANDEDISKYPPISSDGLPAKSSIIILSMTNNKCEPFNN